MYAVIITSGHRLTDVSVPPVAGQPLHGRQAVAGQRRQEQDNLWRRQPALSVCTVQMKKTRHLDYEMLRILLASSLNCQEIMYK